MAAAVVRAALLRAIVALVALVADARHLRSLRGTLTITRAGRRARGKGAVNARESRLAKAGAVVAVAISGAFSRARLK